MCEYVQGVLPPVASCVPVGKYMLYVITMRQTVPKLQVPTQTFFTESFGMPLYMEPNFEDLSCKMIFGEMPPPLAEDPVTTQPCFSSCAIGMVNDSKCKKLPSKAPEIGSQKKLATSEERIQSSEELI